MSRLGLRMVPRIVLTRTLTENFRCWDTEWEIPVPKVNDKPKFEIIQRAW